MDVTRLRAALELIASAVTDKKKDPVILTSGGITLTVRCRNGHVAVSQDVPATVTAPGTVALDAHVLLGMGVNLALALLWRDDLGFLAPALSYSVMTLFNLGVLVFTLRRRLGAVVRPGFLRFCAQMGLLGVGMTGVLWLTRQSVTLMPVLTAWPPWGQLLYHSLVALMGYVLGWVLLNRTLLRRVWRG